MTPKEKELTLQLKKTEDDLQDLELYINDLFDFAPFSICTLTSNGIIVNINQSFKGLTGYSEIEIVGQNADIIFSDDIWKKILQKISESSGKLKGMEADILNKNGAMIKVSVFGVARRDINNNETGYTLTFYDISELKRLQENLEKIVNERTKELQIKIGDMEKMFKLTVGREMKMVELKKEIRFLKEQQLKK
jgi:PAS domain S-box-containing protein